MSKPWDDKMKRIFAASPQDFVSWLLPGAQFVRKAPLELKAFTHTIAVDSLDDILVDDEPAMLHAEFQKQPDPDMPQRVWQYNVEATIEHHCPVYSFVIYLFPGKVAEPTWEVGLSRWPKVHHFRYHNVLLWNLSIEDLRAHGGKGLLPLCFLTQDATNHEAMESVLHELSDEPVLLGLAFGMGSLALTRDVDRLWLKGLERMLGEIVREGWFFQEILQEGREKGLKEGLKEGELQGLQKGRQEGELQGLQKGLDQGLKQGELQGLQKGELQGLRQTVVEVVEERFPPLLALAQSRVEAIHDPVSLRRLIVKMSSVQTAERAEQYLRDL